MIEPEFLKDLQRFHLALKKNSGEVQQGEQDSEFSGHGMIFKDHKEYTPGDDIRRIDWKAYARTKDFYVKRFDEEKNFTVHIIVDRSSSMDFGEESKYDFASKIGLALAYMTNRTNDRFRFSVFSETLTDLTSARRNGNLVNLLDTLNELRKTPESRVEKCITEYSSRIENRSVVVIISDLLTDIDQIRSGLQSLEESDVVLVNVFDEEELDPSMKGDTILEDPESSSTLRAYVSRKTKNEYKSKLQKHVEEIEELCDMNNARYIQASTGEDFFESFIDIWESVNQ
ncbi:MAG: DUF58 domain-containing protein [Candidatus Nanohaloarchaea archaeon]